MSDLSSSSPPTKYLRTLATAPTLAPKLGDRPAWLPLGWEYIESGGDVANNDTSVAALGGEQGLFQLSSDERRATGFTDSARILSDVDYSTDAGLALIDYYGGKVAAAGVDSSNDPLYWYLIKFAHGAGAGAMHEIVSGFADSGGGSLDDFHAYALENPYSGKPASYTKHWLENADKVRQHGLVLATFANLASPGIAPAGLLLLLGVGGLIAWALGSKS